MRTNLRGKVTLLSIVVGLLLAIPAMALADIIVADGDVLTVGSQASRTLAAVNPGATVTARVNFLLDCDGKQHFNRNDTASVNFTGSTIRDAGGITPSTGSATATNFGGFSGPPDADWPADNVDCPTTLSDRELGSSTVTITAPKKAGTYTITVDYSVVRDLSTDQNELRNNITNDPLTFTLPVNNAAPVINSFDGPLSATEGEHHPYRISAFDANEDTLSYDLTKASGTANVSIPGWGLPVPPPAI